MLSRRFTMPYQSVVVGLPIADRRASFAFYRDGLGFDPVGEPAEDGVPEPLQFALNDGVRVMLIPADGFAWAIGDHDVAPGGPSECVLNRRTETDGDVDRRRRENSSLCPVLSPGTDIEALRGVQEAAFDHDSSSPYDR